MSDGLDWALIASTVVASGAWIYQRAWERVEARRSRYEEVLANLYAFTESGLNPDKIDEILAEHRRLWVTAPRRVTNAFSDFLDSVENGGSYSDQDRVDRMNALIDAMRKDASLMGMLYPAGSSPVLSLATFRLQSATRNTPVVIGNPVANPTSGEIAS